MPHIGRNTKPDTLINLHLSFGVLILAVAVVRLGWRMPHTEPPPEDGLPPWQMQSAHVVHFQVLGRINASWRGLPITLFGLLEMPKLVATRMPGFGWTGDVHNALANYAMLALIGLHVAAALYHHFVRRDRVLQRMLPGR